MLVPMWMCLSAKIMHISKCLKTENKKQNIYLLRKKRLPYRSKLFLDRYQHKLFL